MDSDPTGGSADPARPTDPVESTGHGNDGIGQGNDGTAPEDPIDVTSAPGSTDPTDPSPSTGPTHPTGPVDPPSVDDTPMPPSYAPRRPTHPAGPAPEHTRTGAHPRKHSRVTPQRGITPPRRATPAHQENPPQSAHTPPPGPSGTPRAPHEEDADGAARRRARRRRRIRASASVGVVTLASGLLFGLSATSARHSAVPQDVGLVGLVRHQQDSVDQMMSGNQDIQRQVDALVAASAATPSPSPTSVLQLSSVPVSGPGLTVTLTDAPAGPLPDGARPDDLVVHQQDIEDVMNALWSGGAEAMTVQGKRVNARTVIRCIGNVILVDGARFSPPYVVAAIGDTQALQGALQADERIRIYKDYVARYQLGWDVDMEDQLSFDAVAQEPGIRFAQVEDHG